MAWGPFSAEAVTLDSQLRQLHREGRVSDAIGAIEAALERAHQHGPSNMAYADFERAAEAAIHQSHCNSGEYVGSCKYGESDTCPALSAQPSIG